MNKKTWIYEISFIGSDRIYVGQTSKADPSKRFEQHLKSLKNMNHPNQIMQSLFNKYGEESFWTRILDHVNYESRDAAERNWMMSLFAHVSRGGMNLKDPLTREWSDESKAKMRDRFISNETRKKLSEAAKRREVTEEVKEMLRTNSIGKKHTDEAKRKISEARKLYWAEKRALAE